MNSRELSDAVATIVTEAQARIEGVGAEQYADGETQHFEALTPDEILVMAREEVLDLINYGVMLTIQLDRLRDRLPIT